MNYSKIQYFFWIIAGSEINALKECENEYNRHANIGMMISITTIFAFFTALIAAFTFAKDNVFGAVAFALIWALLIFTIDRSMVNSIKKDPHTTDDQFWKYFLPRFILALILAFFMSIPLDHFIFSEAIDRQMTANKQELWLKSRENLEKGYDLSATDNQLKTLTSDLKGLEETLNSACPTSACNESLEAFNTCQGEILDLEKDFTAKTTRAQNYLQGLPRNEYGKIITNETYYKLKREGITAGATLNQKKQECSTLKAKFASAESEWRQEQKDKIEKTKTSKDQTQTKLLNDQNTVSAESDGVKKDLDNQNGFDTKFTTLFLMPDWGIQVLKWGIFLALLVIEILPTYLKLNTGSGQYEMKLKEQEDTMENDIVARIEAQKKISAQTEEYRADKEIELNKNIIDKIASIELNLAERIIDNWEERATDETRQIINNAERI